MFKGDPMFEFAFTKLPRSYFMKIVELRRLRQQAEPQLPPLA